MSFKATVDMFINLSYVQVRFLNRQGFLRFRMKLYMKLDGKQASCHPYNIVKGPTRKQLNYIQEPTQQVPSEIDGDTLYYYSRLIPVKYRPGSYQQNETVFFKAYVSTEVLEDIQFYCVIQCLFTDDPKSKLQVVGKFEAIIRKISEVSTFLPVVFDAFEGFMIFSTFHSAILQFKYGEDDFEIFKSKRSIQISKKCSDFYSYIQFITDRFKRAQLLQFYEYYRQVLQKQHQSIQNQHEQLIGKLLKQTKVKSQQNLPQNNMSFVKILKNNQLLKLIMGRSVYEAYSEPQPLGPHQRQLVVDMIAKDFAVMKGFVYKKWMEFASFVVKNSKPIAKLYRKQYQAICKQRFKNNVFSHKIKNYDWRMSKYNDSGKINLQHAFKEKKKGQCQQQLWKQHFPIQNISFFGKSQTNVKMFEQIYVTKDQKVEDSTYQKSKHIIVLVHGFQASRQDFILLKNCLQVVYGIQVIISTCNEGLTQSSIVLAGRRLASQLKKVLSGYTGDYRLSFIGHSMGGLIIRSAIPELGVLLTDRLYTYMTFSTPHLGYLYQSSTIVKAGLWILSSWQKIQALQELAMKDKSNLRQTVLYKLSMNGALKKFKKICFVCSSLDQYVVYQSARAEQNQKLMKQTLDAQTQQIIRQMVDGIIGQVYAPEISRINVVFNIENKNLDSILGRTGHIKFLSDIQFIRQFCSCFDKFFA